MIPTGCKQHECHYYREERENDVRWCTHPEYDLEANECPGWASKDDVKYGNYDPDDREMKRDRLSERSFT